jgi:hypothetical protein
MRLLPAALLGLLALSLACAGPKSKDSGGTSDDLDTTVAYEGDDAGECADSADNDRDGAFDCDDPDCSASPDCADTDAGDADGDGYTTDDGDCDDADATVHPGATELACSGVDEDCDAATSDAPDADGDGASACDDCDDADPAVYPDASEQRCNGVDDDCDAATADSPDADGDGSSTCDDCDDTDASVSPGATETCDNATDDDCDGDIDEGCVTDFTDTWTFDRTVSYSCAFGLVSYAVDEAQIDDHSPAVDVALPTVGTLTGTFSTSTRFSASDSLAGSCTETMTFAGTFVSATELDATFTLAFAGGSACYDCSAQSWSIVATR